MERTAMNTIKAICVALAALVAGTAHADEPGIWHPDWSAPELGRAPHPAPDEGKWVRTWISGDYVDGDIVPPGHISFLIMKEPCGLPLVKAKHMMRYLEVRYYNHVPKYTEGCWFMTLDGGVTSIMSDGRTNHESIPGEFMPHGRILKNGNLRITEPGYIGPADWMAKKIQEQNAEAIAHQHDKGVQP
jgi:hypothetical protein